MAWVKECSVYKLWAMSNCRLSYRQLRGYTLPRQASRLPKVCLSHLQPQEYRSVRHSSTDSSDTNSSIAYPLSALRSMSRSDLRQINRFKIYADLQHLISVERYNQIFEIASIFSSHELDMNLGAQIEVIKAMWCCTRDPKHAEVALDMFQRLLEKKFTIPQKFIRILADIVIETGDPRLRFKYIMMCRKAEFGEQSLSQIFSKSVLLYANTGELELALSLLAEGTSLGIDITAPTYEVLIHKLLEDNDIDIPLQLLNGMVHDSRRPIYTRIWGHFVAKAAEHQHYDGLKWSFHNAIKPGLIYPSDSVYYSMAETGARYGDLAMTCYAVKQLCDRGFHADTTLTSIAVEAYAREGNLETALRILSSLGESSSEVRMRDLPMLLSKITQSDKEITVASEILLQATKSTSCHPHAQSLLMNITCLGFIRANHIDLGTQLFEEMRDKGVQANQDTFLMLLEKYKIQGSSLGMEDLYINFVPDIIEPSVHINEELILALVGVNDLEKAQQWLNRFEHTRCKPRNHVRQIITESSKEE